MFCRKKATATKLREAIARLHAERGPDISSLTIENVEDPESEVESDDGEAKDAKDDAPPHLKSGAPMPFEDLVKMRDEISFNIQSVIYILSSDGATDRNLSIAVSQASVQLAQLQEVTNLLLAASPPTTNGFSSSAPPPQAAEPRPITMAASLMAPSEQKASIRATNVRVALGVKDALVEDAAVVLSQASSSIANRVEGSEMRWAQAIQARRAHWALLPQRQAAAPHQSPFFRRDDSALPRNFLISFALEDCMSLNTTVPSISDYLTQLLHSSEDALRSHLVSKHDQQRMAT